MTLRRVLNPEIQALLTSEAVVRRHEPFERFAGDPDSTAAIVAALRASPTPAVPKFPVADVWDFVVGSRPTPVRGYRPKLRGPLPIVVYFHGGGWVFGDLDTHDGPCRALANAGRCIVFNVDYGLAPEHRFPEPLHECLEVTRALVADAEHRGGDPARVVVAGASAGANLAAAVTLAELADDSVTLAGQMLFYPALDAVTGSPSYIENASGFNLSAAEMRFYWRTYAGEADLRTPLLSPLYAPDLRGLPPTIIHTAEFDVLRDEGEQYGQCLKRSGVPTVVRRYGGQIHGFASLGNITADAGHSLAEMGRWLIELFAD